jgi:hypothetical protein
LVLKETFLKQVLLERFHFRSFGRVKAKFSDKGLDDTTVLNGEDERIRGRSRFISFYKNDNFC